MYSHHSKNGSNVADTPEYKLNNVLMKKDGWSLVRPLWPNLIGCESYIVHTSCKREGRRSVQGKGVSVRGMCTYCGETPPDEIAGLEILHNGKI